MTEYKVRARPIVDEKGSNGASVFIEKSFGLRKGKGLGDFYAEVVDWSKVERLFDLFWNMVVEYTSATPPLGEARAFVEREIRFSVGFFIYGLPIIDEDGRDWSAEVGIPSAGLLTSVLLNLYLDEFDRAFINSFPRFRYARYRNAIFFFVIENLLKELGLSEKVICIGRGSAPVPFGGYKFLTKTG